MTRLAGAPGALAGALGRERSTPAALAVVTLAAALALWLAIGADVAGPAAVPDVVRAMVAAVALFGLAGYAPARLLVPGPMLPHLPLLILPVGAAWCGLALTLLGFLQVPFEASLPLFAALSAIAAVLARVRLGPARADAAANESAGGSTLRLLLPAALVALIAAVALIPVLRAGFATVVGQNPDGHQAVGSAFFLQHAPPGAVRPDLPLDRMPLVWRSKYPIYYALAGASSAAGMDPIETFATVSALMLALTALAALLFARYALQAGPWASLAALVAVPLDRVLLHVSTHPYYNQLWGTFALLMVLTFGFRLLREPNWRDGALTAFFAAVGAFAYPLMLPFPVAILSIAAIAAWRRAPAERRARVGAAVRGRLTRRRGLWIAAAVVALPALLVLAAGVLEKTTSAAHLVLPDSDLRPWSGDLVTSPPFPGFLGADGSGVAAWAGAIAVLGAGAIGLRRAPARDVAVPLGLTAAGALAFAAYFGARDFGAYLYFKDLAFLAPLVVACAATGLVGLAAQAGDGPRRALAAAAAVLLVVFVLGTRAETDRTFEQLTRPLLGLKSWNDRLPAGTSIRLDLAPNGAQLWAGYMLSQHPLSSPTPLVGTTYPHAPFGIKADYALAVRGRSPPQGARGAPVLSNSAYSLYRLRRDLPGRDVSSRRMVDPAVPSLGG